MNLGKSRLVPLLGVVCAIMSMIVAPAPARAEDKSAVKAALVYNILRFTSFPGSPGHIRVCAQADDPIASALRRLDGRSIGQSRLDVSLLATTSDMGSGCNVIYLDNEPARSVGGASRGQILIGSGRNFAENGGTIGLINFGGQVRFVINSDAARDSRVSFSSQLMQLAAKVVS